MFQYPVTQNTLTSLIGSLFVRLKEFLIILPGNVVRGNQTVMQRKSLSKGKPAMSYGLGNYVNNKISDPVLLFFDSFTARY